VIISYCDSSSRSSSSSSSSSSCGEACSQIWVLGKPLHPWNLGEIWEEKIFSTKYYLVVVASLHFDLSIPIRVDLKISSLFPDLSLGGSCCFSTLEILGEKSFSTKYYWAVAASLHLFGLYPFGWIWISFSGLLFHRRETQKCTSRESNCSSCDDKESIGLIDCLQPFPVTHCMHFFPQQQL